MERAEEMMHAIEAVLFAAGEPLTYNDVRKVFERLWADEGEGGRTEELTTELKAAYNALKKRAQSNEDVAGFTLLLVAEGLTFRSNPRYANVLRAMREEKPVRLSQAALETLAIIAYRQPVTKPEADHIRGVDCGGTLRLLLDRGLVRIVGKREEPGRPMLYGTTKEFLSFFNLPNLAQLPTLREFHELTPESQEEVEKLEVAMPSLRDLSEKAKKLALEEDPGLAALDQAVMHLNNTETTAREALAIQGIALEEQGDGAPASAPAAATFRVEVIAPAGEAAARD